MSAIGEEAHRVDSDAALTDMHAAPGCTAITVRRMTGFGGGGASLYPRCMPAIAVLLLRTAIMSRGSHRFQSPAFATSDRRRPCARCTQSRLPPSRSRRRVRADCLHRLWRRKRQRPALSAIGLAEHARKSSGQTTRSDTHVTAFTPPAGSVILGVGGNVPAAGVGSPSERDGVPVRIIPRTEAAARSSR